ncbi:MAG TPA: class A beta-lactamase-related serine hydrolase, partial [Candidatus Aminicenantes bacterium]|nr:class A beta-lactamase-related serine hydrolase [Candidatus Aminicenantes bacterium]
MRHPPSADDEIRSIARRPGRAVLAVLTVGLAFALAPASSSGRESGTVGPASPSPVSRSDENVLPPDFDALVARVMRTFEVPGMAVAVVKDGATVLAKGYGVRRMGEPDAVDARTLFGIASNTKAFTATALGLLVEEGKIEWDGQVTRYLPWFQMWDPYVTREITVRDLLVHRSGLGLGAGDLLLWPETTYTRREIVERLRFIPLATSFRSAYAYDNMLYVAAGELIEAVSGVTWEEFIRERVLRKAGMDSSEPRHSAAGAEARNVAMPHAALEGGVTPVAIDENDNMNAAGGIVSCAEDMARWMLIHLAGGKLPDGGRLFGERTARELTTLVTPIPIGAPAPELAAQRQNFNGYALGFRVGDYRGRKLVNHTGGLSGYVSRVVMVPELGLGVAVLTNQESSDAYNSVIFAVLDEALGAPPTDWAAAYSAVRARSRSRTAGALED